MLAALIYVAVVKVPALQHVDVRVLEGFMGLWGLPGTSLTDDFIRLFNPGPFAVLSGSLIVAALVAKRYRQAALAFTVMLGAGVTTQILKPLLAVQREYPVWHFMGPEAYPSGHTTAVMSLALALVIVAPTRWRALAAAGGGLLTVATVFSILVHGGHYPSDIVGGFLVATGWAYLGSAALRVEARPSVAGPVMGGAVLARDRAAGGAVAARGRAQLRGREHDVRRGRAGDRRRRAGAQRKRPGSQSGSAPPAATFTPRERMNSRSLSRLR